MSNTRRVKARIANRVAPASEAPRTFVAGATGLSIQPFSLERFSKAARVFRRQSVAALTGVRGWLIAQRATRLSSKRLRVVETVSLGEKRFAALLSVDGAEFLIGGSSSSVAMLASLDRSAAPTPFAATLQQSTAEPAQC